MCRLAGLGCGYAVASYYLYSMGFGWCWNHFDLQMLPDLICCIKHCNPHKSHPEIFAFSNFLLKICRGGVSSR